MKFSPEYHNVCVKFGCTKPVAEYDHLQEELPNGFAGGDVAFAVFV
jgi:hypothetical protein